MGKISDLNLIEVLGGDNSSAAYWESTISINSMAPSSRPAKARGTRALWYTAREIQWFDSETWPPFALPPTLFSKDLHSAPGAFTTSTTVMAVSVTATAMLAVTTSPARSPGPASSAQEILIKSGRRRNSYPSLPQPAPQLPIFHTVLGKLIQRLINLVTAPAEPGYCVLQGHSIIFELAIQPCKPVELLLLFRSK